MGFLEGLRSALTRLAARPDKQKRYLTTLGVADMLDELALEFDDMYRVVAPTLAAEFGEEAAEKCEALDASLRSGSLGWRFADLTSPEWENIRSLAMSALEELQ
jgi:hypothetical protein